MLFIKNYLAGERAVDRFTDTELLRSLYSEFMTIPYENATKIIKKNEAKERLRKPEELFSDFLRAGTGGTCFSLVYALYKLLVLNKFQTYMVLGDRYYGADTHAAVVVDFSQCTYLLDPGFLVQKPVKIPEAIGANVNLEMPATGNLLFEKLPDGNIRVVSLEKGAQLKFRHTIKMKEVPEQEFIKYWQGSFEFKMMENLCITKIKDNIRQLYLIDNRLEIITKEKREKIYIKENFSDTIAAAFGIEKNIIEEVLKCHKLWK